MIDPNNDKEEQIPEELRKAVKKIFSEPQDKIEVIRVILELQNESIKNLIERVKKLEQESEKHYEDQSYKTI